MDVINILKNGGVVVMPTDTIYGILGSALNEKTVEKVYQLRKRNLDKPFIILISSLNDLNQFNIKLTKKQKEFLEKHWPNPISVILSCNSEKFQYLHRGKNSLAFRIPSDQKLLEILKQIGPLVAPSANYEGQKPSETIAEAKKYFGEKVGLYIDGGIIKSKASTLIEFDKKGFKILRQGSFKI